MSVISTIIFPVAGYFYSLFGALGKIALMPISQVVSGYIVSQSNPFTDFVAVLQFDGSPILGELLGWLAGFIPVLDMSVFGVALAIVPASFLFSMAVRSIALFFGS